MIGGNGSGGSGWSGRRRRRRSGGRRPTSGRRPVRELSCQFLAAFPCSSTTFQCLTRRGPVSTDRKWRLEESERHEQHIRRQDELRDKAAR